jgi:hypothetical protein
VWTKARLAVGRMASGSPHVRRSGQQVFEFRGYMACREIASETIMTGPAMLGNSAFGARQQ